MTIGYFGNIIFETSDQRVLTFNDFTRNSTAHIEEHKLIGKKPLIEYCGPELEKINFTVNLNAYNGINPEEELAKWRDYSLNGSAQELVIGGNVMGYDKFIIESLSESYNKIYKNGFLYSAKIDVSLAEYISDPKLQPQKTNKIYSVLDNRIPYYTNLPEILDYSDIREKFNDYILPASNAINFILALINTF